MESEPKKKILYVVTQPEWGGAQRYIYDLATSEEAKNYDIVVAYGKSDSKVLVEKLEAKNIKTHELKYLVRNISLSDDLVTILDLVKLYGDEQADIVHLNSTKAGVLGSFAGFASRYMPFHIRHKIIYTVHGWVFNEPLKKSKKKLYKFLEKFTAKFKHKLICVSEFDRNVGIENKMAPDGKLVTIHNGIDTDYNFLEKEEAKTKLFNNHKPSAISHKLIIGTIANFYATKGLQYFIEAIKILTEKDKNILGVVIGEGELRPELEKQIEELGLKDNFLLLGSKENGAQYLKAFDVYACSSVKEGLPYSVIEALSAGLPTVSTEVGGIPEIIQHEKNGLLVEPKNSEKLAGAIKTLTRDKELATKLAEQGVRDMKENFSKDVMIKKTFEQYK